MIIKDDYKEPNIFDEMQPKYMTLKQLKSIYTANSDIQTGTEATVAAAGQAFKQSLKETIFSGIPTVAGQLFYKAGEKIEEVGELWKNRFFDENNQVSPTGGEIFNGNEIIEIGKSLQETGRVNIRTANRNLQMLRDDFEKNRIPISREERDSVLFSVASQALDYPVQLGLAYLNPALSIGYMATRVLGGEAVEGLEKYKKEMGDISGFELKSGEELGLNVANAVVQSVWERAFGAPAQLKNFMNSKGMLKLFGRGFTEEFATENLQNLTDAVFDDFSGRLDKDETVASRLAQNFRDTVVAGMFGGTSGTAFAIHNRSKGIDDIANNLLGESVPDDEKRAVATAIYENGVNTLQGLITTELETSSSLRAHHGEVYQSMFDNVLKAVQDAKNIGAFASLDESELARYANTEAKRFADQVLAEATMRKKPVSEVFSASDVSYENGKLSLRINGVNTEVSGQDVAQGVLDQSKLANAVDLTKLFNKRPSQEDVENYINSIIGKAMDTATYPLQIQVTEDNKGHVVGANIKLKGNQSHRHNAALKSLQEIVSKAIVDEKRDGTVDLSHNTKQETLEHKRGLEKYVYFNSLIRIGEDFFTVELHTELPKARENKDLFDLYHVRVKRNLPAASKDTLLSGGSYKSSMAQNERDVNSLLQQQALFQESLDIANQNAELDANNPAYEGETININGVERTVYNSNGDRIAMSEPALRNFYKWFGDSKVVDEQGRPLVVYHGTSAEFDEFRKGNIFTTDNQEVASEYGSLGAMPLYMKLENPLIVDAYGQSFGEIYNAEGMKKAYKDLTEEDYKKLADTFFDGDIKEAKEWYPQNEQGEVNLARAYGEKPRATNEWANYARKEGYDGVIIKDVNDTVDISNIRATDYVAFNPSQIKSTSNRGTYSESDNIYYQGGEERNLVVQHGTTLEKLEEALELGAMPMPSLAVTKAEYAGKSNFGEIVFVGGSNIIDPQRNKANKTFTADIYSTRKVSPTFEFNDEGRDYVKRQTDNISKKGVHYWTANILADLERGVDYHLKEIYMASIGKISDLDGSTYKIVQDMTDKQKADFAVWKRKFIREYTDKNIFEGFTPSGKRRYSPYDLKNVLRVMQKENLKGSESTASGNAHALRGVWAEELKSIDAIRDAKGRIVDEELYQQMDNVIWEETTKLSDLLVSEKKAEELERSWISPDEYMIEEALVSLKPSSNIAKILENADLRSDKKAVDAVKRYMKLVKDLPVRYFESKPQRAVDFSEFKGVIMPTDKEYDAVAREMEDRGLKVVRSDNQVEAMKQFDEVFFQDKSNPQGPRGANASIELLGDKALISLFEKADAHSLPHELAHYWLDAMFKYVKSGNATPEYMERWNAIAKHLGIKPNQERLTRRQQEIWASGYETYLNTQVAPVPVIRGLFDDYNRWLQRVYRELKTNPTYTSNDGKKHTIRLSDEMIRVFNSMTTGEFIARPDVERMATKVTPKLEKAVVELETKGAEEIQKMENATTYPSTIIKPTKAIRGMVRGEADEDPDNSVNISSVAMRELGEAFGYQKKNLAEEYAKAEAWVRGNLARAKEVVYGKVAPDGLLSTAINIAYVREMENMGNYVEAQKATRVRSFEQTLRGQEISMERVTTDDALSMSYWTGKVLARKEHAVASRFFKNDIQALRKFIDKESKALAHEIKGKPEDEKKMIIAKKLQELSNQYGSTTLYQMNEDLPDTYDQLYIITRSLIEDSVGINITDEQTNEISSNVDRMKKMFENSASKNGNPSIETFKKLDEMNKLIDSYSPTNQGVVWSSIYGRSAMLASVKSPITNIVSNVENFITEKLARIGMNIINGQTNDNLVSSDRIKDYIKWNDDVYAASGYMPTITENIFEETPKTLGESRPHSQGKGIVRQVGRVAENLVFKQLMGRPDNFAKGLVFADVAGNRATQIAYEEGLTGEGAVLRANELFDDAVLLNPQTEEGQQIRKQAMEAAHQTTYTQDSKLAQVALRIREVLNTVGGKNWKMGDMLMPFVRTPANVVSAGLDYAIGSVYTLYNVKEIIQNPKSDVSQKAIRSAVRNGEGVLLALLISAFLDEDDYIPEFANLSPKMREMVKLQGGVYNSIRLFGHWVSLDYFGTLGVPLAGIMKARQRENLFNSLFAYGQGTVEQLLKVPGFREAADVIGSIQEIGAYDKKPEEVWKEVFDWTTDQAYTRTVPAFVNDIGKFLDTYERETDREMLKRIQSKIPFLREQLPAKTSIATGGKVKSEGWKALLFGSRVSEDSDNRLVNEVEKLMKQENMPSVSDPTRYGKLKDLPIDKKNQARAYFNTQYAREVKKIMSKSGYNRMKPEEKKKAFDKVRRELTEKLKERYKLK